MNSATKNLIYAWFVILLLALQGCASMTPKEADNKRIETRAMADQTLAELKRMYPEAKGILSNAAGYAVFSNYGFKVMFGGSARGSGLAVNNATGQTTYMKMFELQPGFGFGVQKFKMVFLFDTQQAFDKFINSGWEFGANSAVSFKKDTEGVGGQMGVVVSPGVHLYQIGETGAIVGVSVTGAKYYKDSDLN